MTGKEKKVVCVDSFKYEYLKHAPFLSAIAKRCQNGRLKFPLGFEGGMETFFEGNSNTLALFYFSKNSFLKWTRKFAWLGFFLNFPINLIRLLRKHALFLIRKIPYGKLWMFDFAISSFKKKKNLEYMYIGKLDKVAHKYGITSRETIECIKRIDKKLSKIKFDLVLSDHGMMDIKGVVNVPKSQICFIDSTMARYWGDKRELDEIRKKLPKNKGRIINWPDKRFGDLIWLAEPGILILPNYWQGDRTCKAMHGYSPKCREMDGFYILREKKGTRKDLEISQLRKQFFFSG